LALNSDSLSEIETVERLVLLLEYQMVYVLDLMLEATSERTMASPSANATDLRMVSLMVASSEMQTDGSLVCSTGWWLVYATGWWLVYATGC
jgi:hypothetical protein